MHCVPALIINFKPFVSIYIQKIKDLIIITKKDYKTTGNTD
jgi:hypothetical protein